MTTPSILNVPTFHIHKMVNEAAISAAIADLKTQAVRNYAATTKNFDIDRRTLQRRFEGKTVSKSEAHVDAQGLLDVAQEAALVERINELSKRGIPPTPKTVENLVFEITQEPPGEHWVSRFIKRHDNTLDSIYLDSIDYSRRVADNSRHFEHYCKLVRSKLPRIENLIRLISSSLRRRSSNIESAPLISITWTRRAS